MLLPEDTDSSSVGAVSAPTSDDQKHATEDQKKASEDPQLSLKIATRPVIFVGISGPSGVGKSTAATKIQNLYGIPVDEVTGSLFSYASKHWKTIDSILATGCPDGTMTCPLRSTGFDWHPESVDLTFVEKVLLNLNQFWNTTAECPDSYVRKGGSIVRDPPAGTHSMSEKFVGREMSFDCSILVPICTPALFYQQRVCLMMVIFIYLQADKTQSCERKLQRNRTKISRRAAFRKDFEIEWRVHEATVLQQITSAQDSDLSVYCFDTSDLDADGVHARVEHWLSARLREHFEFETVDFANGLLWGRTERPILREAPELEE